MSEIMRSNKKQTDEKKVASFVRQTADRWRGYFKNTITKVHDLETKVITQLERYRRLGPFSEERIGAEHAINN